MVINMENERRLKGKVVKVHEKGYGFIISDEVRFVKFFFHWSALNSGTKFTELKSGDNVEFTPQMNDMPENVELNGAKERRGPRAIKINLVN